MRKVYIGTSGFSNSFWRGDFYPADAKSADFLAFYSQRFPTVEINSTFYHIPRLTTTQKWLITVPTDFIFTFKASKLVTHSSPEESSKHLATFLASLQPFTQTSTKHLILFQFPAHLSDLTLLKNIFKQLPTTFRYAVELRNATLFNQSTYQLLGKYQISLVLADSPINKDQERIWPLVDQTTSPISYLRFHGSSQLYRSEYSEVELNKYATLIKKKIQQGQTVFCYFNNTASLAGLQNAQRLSELLGDI